MTDNINNPLSETEIKEKNRKNEEERKYFNRKLIKGSIKSEMKEYPKKPFKTRLTDFLITFIAVLFGSIIGNMLVPVTKLFEPKGILGGFVWVAAVALCIIIGNKISDGIAVKTEKEDKK